MAKFKNVGWYILRFDNEGKEKAIEPGHVATLEKNEYIEGLLAIGLLKEEPESVTKTTEK